MKHYYTSSTHIPSTEKKTRPSAKVIRNILKYSAAMKLLHSANMMVNADLATLAN